MQLAQPLTCYEYLRPGPDKPEKGSTFQNRTVHPCEKVCEIIDDSAQRLCDKYCPNSEAWDYGWFDMADPEVAYYINAVGRSVFISQVYFQFG